MKLVNPYEGQGPAWEAKRRAWDEGVEKVKCFIFEAMREAREEMGEGVWTPAMVTGFFNRVRASVE